MNIMITGASGDIGIAITEKLAQKGHRLILCGNRNTEGLTRAAAVCEEAGVDYLTYQGDLSDEAFANSAVSGALLKFGRIDALVHAAGSAKIALMTDLTSAEWNSIINSSLTSLYRCCHAVVPGMVHEKAGKILAISSVWGLRGASCEVAYSAAKGGIHAFTKALAKELAPSNITVNALALGMIDTKMNDCLSEDDKQAICDEIPVGYIAKPSEVAEMAALLLEAPSYLTGQIIGFDGGWQV